MLTRNNTSYPLILSKLLSKTVPDENDILQYHQRIVQEYFKLNVDSRGLLVFHGTGTGKTMLAVAIAETMRETRNVIIISAKSLQENFKKEVVKYKALIHSNTEDDYNYVSSNASNMQKKLTQVGKTEAEITFDETIGLMMRDIKLEGSLVIVDEAQNLFNGITNGSKNATSLYEAIMNASNIKLVFLSATPIINDPFSIVPMFNMLHGKILLPVDYMEFNNMYINDYSIKNREKLKNRIYGLVSYMGNWWQSGGITDPNAPIIRPNFPVQLPTIVEKVPMSNTQFAAYANARDMEQRVTGKKGSTAVSLQKPKSDPGSTYRVASRLISNYYLLDNIKVKNIDSFGFTKHLNNLSVSQLRDLDTYSPKMKRILSNLDNHTGTAVVYSAFVNGEGLGIFARVLEQFGWNKYSADTKSNSYVLISGNMTAEERTDIINTFNSDANKTGALIRLMLLSGVGAEGLDLKNVRSIHIMEPYWNYGRIEQIIARAVRYMSHSALEEADRTVQPYIYLSDYPIEFVFKPTKLKKTLEKTTDVHLYIKSIKAQILIDKLYGLMIEASIDCPLHIRTAPPEVQERIKCLMCAPTDSQLFHPSFDIDLKIENPCRSPAQTDVDPFLR